MFALSRWSGGLIRRVGHRLPLTVGPLIAAIGLAAFALPARDRYVVALSLLAVIILGVGMAITVAPLTTTVMESVSSEHSGVASGVNNAVARVAGLIAIVVNTAMIETPLLLTSRPDWAAFSAHSLRQPQGRSRDGTPHSRTTQRSMRKMPVLGAERKRGHDGRMQTLSSAGGDGPRGRRCPEHCELGMAADARRGMVRRMDRPKVPHATSWRRLSTLQSSKPLRDVRIRETNFRRARAETR